MLKDDYKQLSVAEKILLVEEIGDSIAQETSLPIGKQQQALITRREKELLNKKVKTKTWEEIKGGLKKKRA